MVKSYLLNQISGYPWVLKPECLEVFANVLEMKFLENIDMNDYKATLARREEDVYNSEVSFVGNTAILPICGKLMHKCGWLDACSGMQSIQTLSEDFQKLVLDDRISRIILKEDSPGGSSYGIPQFAQQIRNARKVKRISTFVDNEMCSGALWIGTAADEVYCSNPIVEIGSIGVYAMHINQAALDAKEGLQYTIIKAGKFKAMGNSHESLTSEALELFQEGIDAVYETFLEEVSLNRNMLLNDVKKYAEGKVFLAKNLLDSGLIDGICSFDEFLND